MNSRGWYEGVRDSEIFLVIGTESYFEDAICFCQAEIAKELNKPFRILLKNGVEIPPDFLNGVKDFAIERWNTKKDLYPATLKLLAISTYFAE
jgi:hypothetical protein